MTRRVTLEQKIRRLVRNYRARQQRAAGESRDGTRCQQPLTIKAFAVVLMLWVVLPAKAVNPATFEQANEAYAAGRFADAAGGFEQVIAQHGYSAPVLFNLGNSWLKSGQPGRAILNYERALLLSPGNSAIEANLRAARQAAGIETGEGNLLEKAARGLSLNAWAGMGAGTLVLVCALVFVRRLLPLFSGTVARLFTGAGALALVAVMVCLAARWSELDRAVVLDAGVPVRIAPAVAASVSFNLAAGEMVYAQQSYRGYTWVRTSDGHSGWIRDAEVARVIPG